jgi:hypothetical protein
MIVKMIVESRWNVDWQGKPKFSEKTCPSATFVHHKIPHATRTYLRKRIDEQNMTEHRQKSEEVRSEFFVLYGVVTVTFRVLSLFVVTRCYSYSKTVL